MRKKRRRNKMAFRLKMSILFISVLAGWTSVHLSQGFYPNYSAYANASISVEERILSELKRLNFLETIQK